jgi:hypothetical protein
MAKSWIRAKQLRKVTVHLVGSGGPLGPSITGHVAQVTSEGILLRAATLLADPAQGSPKDTPLTAETWIPAAQVIFVQGEE